MADFNILIIIYADSKPSEGFFHLVWEFDGRFYTLTKNRFTNAKEANQHCKDNAGTLVEFKSSKQLTAAFDKLEKIPGVDNQGIICHLYSFC